MRAFGKVLIAFSLTMTVATAWAAGQMSIQVRSSAIRNSPSFLGDRVGPVAYGEQVEVLRQEGDWMEVKTPGGGKGWIHQSALTRKRVVFSSGASDVSSTASGEELALSGKGFSAGVEEKFKVDKDVDFTWVDRMEKIVISPQEIASFLAEGGLQPLESGAK